jgi:hypothetical protein
MVQRIAFFLLLSGLACPGEDTFARYSTPAEWHRSLKRPVEGTLVFDDAGVEFQSPKFSRRWLYGDIKTFDLISIRPPGGQELVITDYENRHWHEPGERQFRFTLRAPVSPQLAAGMTSRVGRPVINGNPDPGAGVIGEFPAHRRKRIGGSNGTLRFRDDGIDYVTPDGLDGRRWRWTDIQTLANPNPWEFRVSAYREIVEFDLKQPLSRDLFDTLWGRLYAAGDHQ